MVIAVIFGFGFSALLKKDPLQHRASSDRKFVHRPVVQASIPQTLAIPDTSYSQEGAVVQDALCVGRCCVAPSGSLVLHTPFRRDSTMRTSHNHDESRAATAAEADYCARAHRRHCRYRYGEQDPTGLPTHVPAKSTVDSLDMTGFARPTSLGGGTRDQEDEDHHQLPTNLDNQRSGYRSRLRLPKLWSLTPSVTLVLILAILSRPCGATFIAFENCLSESYVNNEPKLLQWVPAGVDASFITTDAIHTLRITMWGNVTGSTTNDTLPAWNDTAYWNDAKKTVGKILSVPEPNAANKLTTLLSEIKFLTYQPFFESANFCTDKLVNASCPLGPVFNATPR